MRCCDPRFRRTFLYQSTIALAGSIGVSRLGWGSMVDERVAVMRWHPSTGMLVAASDSCLQVIDPRTGRVTNRILLETQKVLDVALDPTGQFLLVAGGDPSYRGIVELRRWPSGDLLQSHVVEGDVVTRVAWSSDGERWLEVDWNGGCRIHSVSTREQMSFLGHTRTVLAAAWSVTHPWVATAGVESTIHLWNPNDGQAIRRFDQHTRPVVALDFLRPDPNEDPHLVSAGDDETLRLWQPGIGRLIRFARLPAKPLAMAWLGVGLRCAVALSDGRIMHVDLADVSVRPLSEAHMQDRIQALALNETRDLLFVMRQSGLQTIRVLANE